MESADCLHCQDHDGGLCRAVFGETSPRHHPLTKTGDYSDVKVIDAEGREIPWNQVSRINQDKRRTLITGIVDRIHTFLSRTIFCAFNDQAFNRALDKSAAPWTKHWDEPKYLPDFLMPVIEEDRK